MGTWTSLGPDWQGQDESDKTSRNKSGNVIHGETKHCKQISVRVELRFPGRNSFVSTRCGHVVAKSANAGLGNYKFTARKLQGDPTFLFSPFGFEDGGITFNRRHAAAFSFVRARTLRRFVFVDPRKCDLKTLLA